MLLHHTLVLRLLLSYHLLSLMCHHTQHRLFRWPNPRPLLEFLPVLLVLI